MFSCYLKCRENTGGKIPEVSETKKGNILLLFWFAVCGHKKSKVSLDLDKTLIHEKLSNTDFVYRVALKRPHVEKNFELVLM